MILQEIESMKQTKETTEKKTMGSFSITVLLGYAGFAGNRQLLVIEMYLFDATAYQEAADKIKTYADVCC